MNSYDIGRKTDQLLKRGKCGHGRNCRCRKNAASTEAYRVQTAEILARIGRPGRVVKVKGIHMEYRT